MRRSGLILALAGLAGVAFFWLTDPRWGYLSRWGTAENPIDAHHQALVGTVIGVAGSIIVVLIGLWIAVRKTT